VILEVGGIGARVFLHGLLLTSILGWFATTPNAFADASNNQQSGAAAAADKAKNQGESDTTSSAEEVAAELANPNTTLQSMNSNFHYVGYQDDLHMTPLTRTRREGAFSQFCPFRLEMAPTSPCDRELRSSSSWTC
jgi:hypothetical protein